MKLLASCPNMIPTERCLVVVFQSMSLREEACEAQQAKGYISTVSRLDQHGVDEIACCWDGQLEVTGYETPTGYHAEGDCPRCGQPILITAMD